ncbi:nudix hydrolase 2 isoform X2 [Jatropha curcas]|uniref:nudix hydrolase 2 isoform X2 n=1 Tax=Jatropha curcas TaxID=180498 RepID=UPI00189624A0|nr:nudix hydrolase 2 isoform X2 [Jatropha curcas]
MAIVGCAKCRHTSSDLPLVLHNKDSSVLIKNLSASTPPLIVKEQMEAKDGVIEQIGLQSAVEDSYGGVTVDMKEPVDPKVFLPLLRASISKWRQQGKKGVWIKLPIELASLVAPLVQERFRYHHAESDYLMLVYWIPNTPNTLPENASHRVGIGAFVLNSKRQVLVVKERNGEFKGKGVWKLPTGVVNEGEDICTAAVREVKEETGIETEFVEVLAFSGCQLRSMWSNLTIKSTSCSNMLLKYAKPRQKVHMLGFLQYLWPHPLVKRCICT